MTFNAGSLEGRSKLSAICLCETSSVEDGDSVYFVLLKGSHCYEKLVTRARLNPTRFCQDQTLLLQTFDGNICLDTDWIWDRCNCVRLIPRTYALHLMADHDVPAAFKFFPINRAIYMENLERDSKGGFMNYCCSEGTEARINLVIQTTMCYCGDRYKLCSNGYEPLFDGELDHDFSWRKNAASWYVKWVRLLTSRK